MYIYIDHISTWLFAFRVGREEHQTDLDWALWFCWSRCCHMRLAAPAPRQHSKNMCCSAFSVSTFVFGISLCVFLTLSLSLPPSLSSSCLSLYLNILFSVHMCLSVVWEWVFDCDKKGATVQVQGNSWYQSVEPLSLSLSHFLSISLSSLTMCLSSNFGAPRQ